MRILLVNPSWERYVSRKGSRINRAWPPLDLLNIAAMLRPLGHEVRLLDARARPCSPQELAAAARAADWVFVTSSPLDRWQCPNLEIDLFLEQLAPLEHPKLVLMGVHGTHFPEHLLERSKALAVVQGEPELTVAALAKGTAFEQIPGLAWRDSGRVRKNAPAALADLKTFPIPAFDLLEPDAYSYELLGERFFILETTRGCPFPCTFCQRDLYGGRTYRYKTPAQVAREVEAALAAGMRTGYFIDLEFSLNRKYSLEVCEALRPFRGRWRWCVQTRADSIDPELLRAMKDAGCDLVHIGVETGSAELLEKVEKKITHAQIEEGVAMMRAAGIDVACFFMCGLPDETDADREQTLSFAQRLNATYASFHIANPYPGTPLYAKKPGSALYPESFYQGEALENIRRWEKSAYRRYYLRPQYVLSRAVGGHWRQLAHQARLFLQMS